MFSSSNFKRRFVSLTSCGRTNRYEGSGSSYAFKSNLETDTLSKDAVNRLEERIKGNKRFWNRRKKVSTTAIHPKTQPTDELLKDYYERRHLEDVKNAVSDALNQHQQPANQMAMDQTLQSLRLSLEKVQNENASLRQQVGSLQKEMCDARSKHTQAETTIITQNKKLDKAQDDVTGLHFVNNGLMEQIQSAKRDIAELNASIFAAEREEPEVEQNSCHPIYQHGSLSGQINTLKQKLSRTECQLRECQMVASGADEDSQSKDLKYQELLDSFQQSIMAQRKNSEEVTTRIKDLTTELEQKNEEICVYKHMLEEERSQVTLLEHKIAEKDQQYFDIKKSFVDIKLKLTIKTQELSLRERALADAKFLIDAKDKKLEKNQKIIQSFKDDIHQKDNLIQALIQQIEKVQKDFEAKIISEQTLSADIKEKIEIILSLSDQNSKMQDEVDRMSLSEKNLKEKLHMNQISEEDIKEKHQLIQTLTEENSKLQNELTASSLSAQTLSKDIEDKKHRIQSLSDENARLQSEFEMRDTVERKQSRQIEALTSELNEREDQMLRMEQEMSMVCKESCMEIATVEEKYRQEISEHKTIIDQLRKEIEMKDDQLKQVGENDYKLKLKDQTIIDVKNNFECKQISVDWCHKQIQTDLPLTPLTDGNARADSSASGATGSKQIKVTLKQIQEMRKMVVITKDLRIELSDLRQTFICEMTELKNTSMTSLENLLQKHKGNGNSTQCFALATGYPRKGNGSIQAKCSMVTATTKLSSSSSVSDIEPEEIVMPQSFPNSNDRDLQLNNENNKASGDTFVPAGIKAISLIESKRGLLGQKSKQQVPSSASLLLGSQNKTCSLTSTNTLTTMKLPTSHAKVIEEKISSRLSVSKIRESVDDIQKQAGCKVSKDLSKSMSDDLQCLENSEISKDSSKPKAKELQSSGNIKQRIEEAHPTSKVSHHDYPSKVNLNGSSSSMSTEKSTDNSKVEDSPTIVQNAASLLMSNQIPSNSSGKAKPKRGKLTKRVSRDSVINTNDIHRAMSLQEQLNRKHSENIEAKIVRAKSDTVVQPQKDANILIGQNFSNPKPSILNDLQSKSTDNPKVDDSSTIVQNAASLLMSNQIPNNSSGKTKPKRGKLGKRVSRDSVINTNDIHRAMSLQEQLNRKHSENIEAQIVRAKSDTMVKPQKDANSLIGQNIGNPKPSTLNDLQSFEKNESDSKKKISMTDHLTDSMHEKIDDGKMKMNAQSSSAMKKGIDNTNNLASSVACHKEKSTENPEVEDSSTIVQNAASLLMSSQIPNNSSGKTKPKRGKLAKRDSRDSVINTNDIHRAMSVQEQLNRKHSENIEAKIVRAKSNTVVQPQKDANSLIGQNIGNPKPSTLNDLQSLEENKSDSKKEVSMAKHLTASIHHKINGAKEDVNAQASSSAMKKGDNGGLITSRDR